MLWIYVLLFGGVVVYAYRGRLFYVFLTMLIETMRATINTYVFFSKYGREFRAKKTSELKDGVYLHECEVVKDGKTYKMHILNNDSTKLKKEQVVHKFLENFDKRNWIVHCSLTDDREDVILDLTEVFRDFVYHYDCKDEYSTLKSFLNVVEKQRSELSGLVQKMKLIIYLNDSVFTELVHTYDDIKHLYFCDILYQNKERTSSEDSE